MDYIDRWQAELEFTKVVPDIVRSYLAEFGFTISESGGRHCDAENEHYNITIFLEWTRLETWLRPKSRDAETEYERVVIGWNNVVIPDGIEPEARRQMEALVTGYGSDLRNRSIDMTGEA